MQLEIRNYRGEMKKIALLIAISAFLLNPVSGAVIAVGNSSAVPGALNYAPITLAGMDNFGVANIELYYDPGVVNVITASLGFSGYGGSLTSNINNNIGKATFLVMVSDIPGPNSPLPLLNVSFKAAGLEGQTSTLGLNVPALTDTDGIPPADLSINNGIFMVLPTTIPPASVTNLVNVSYASNYINWTWTDPQDIDFSRLKVYLNGVFKADIFKGKQYYNASGLAQGTVYSIGTRTVDTFGNINATWVNKTSTTSILQDTTNPVITRLGTSPVTVQVGSVYADAGATALDNYDGNITSNIVKVNPVNTVVKGTYTVTYNVNDSSGNAAVQVTRTVNVVDTIIPVITRLGTSPVTVQVGSVYADAGATALDNYDGNITASIKTVNPVNTAVKGTYTVSYKVNDSSNNAAIQVIRTITVVDATDPSLIPPSSVTNLMNLSYVQTYIKWRWTDPTDPDFAKVIVYIDGAFKTNVTKGIQFYKISGLKASTTHTISTRTVDSAGNINKTWVNHTARTSPASVKGKNNRIYKLNNNYHYYE